MIPIPATADRIENEKRVRVTEGETGCIVCGRPIKDAKARYWLHVWYGSDAVTEEEATALTAKERAEGTGCGDSGCWPIGPDCLKQHPELRPYVQRSV